MLLHGSMERGLESSHHTKPPLVAPLTFDPHLLDESTTLTTADGTPAPVVAPHSLWVAGG